MKKREASKGEKRKGTLDCVVGLGVKVEGRLSCGGFLWVEGECIGSLESEENIVVAAGAKIKADIKGRDVVVAGRISGSIEAEDAVRLTPSARVQGDIRSRRFSMEEGAIYSGRVGRPAE
ncbi:MAG: polymer-forming cytoskeletal protein [Spirochaetes bacterium]|nr:polymer-forming cytoskeletal protein [Spirochaetota bacterium]